LNSNDHSINVSLVQPDLVWEDIPANLDMLENMFSAIPEGTDLIILPETFSTGFTMRADRFAEDTPSGRALLWMREISRKKKCILAGSLIVREKNQIYNRLYWVSPEGLQGHYDKRHLFRMGREDRAFSPGSRRKIFTCGAFRVMPQICYDLRFPVFSRNRGDYDILVYAANWPAPRHGIWETLLRARAIENQSCVLGVNRSGVDGERVDHLGGTCVIDPLGNVVRMLDKHPGILNTTIHLEKIRAFREKFPVWKDADRFTLSL
jgi:predicted amidohydrolase